MAHGLIHKIAGGVRTRNTPIELGEKMKKGKSKKLWANKTEFTDGPNFHRH
jgi:hypothetical protein